MYIQDKQTAKETKMQLTKQTIKLLWKYSSKHYLYLILVLISALVSAAVGLLAYYYMGEVTDVIPYLAGIPDFMKHDNYLHDFIVAISLMGAFFIIQFIFSALQSRLLVTISQDLGYYLRHDLFNKLQKLSASYLDAQSTGNLMSVFTNDIDVLVAQFSQIINSLVSAFFFTIGGVIFITLINPILSVIALGICGFLFLFVIIFIKKSQPYFIKQQEMLGELSSLVQEYNFAHEMTTLYGYEKEVINNFEKQNLQLKKATRKAQTISGLIFPYNNFINNFVITVIMILIFVLLCFKPELIEIAAIKFDSPIAIILMFIMILRQTTSKISEMLSQLNALQLTFAAAQRVQSILNVPNENNTRRTKNLKVSKADVKFNDIFFGYLPDKPVLKGINFNAKPGTMTAIVGPTGSGKTTIISLLSAFYDLDKGSICIDNQDIATCRRHSIRDNIALVLQDSFIFNDTILENIRYGRLDATREEIIKAAKLSNADKFISRLPKGYDTVISNDFELLSEGEKQLISIARIFLSKAKILILDEATSYVDTKTEKDIQKATKKLMKSRTSLVIAHRLSTIKDADNIIVIKDGVQIEQGNHHELMKNKKFYYQLNTAMDGDFDIEKNK